MKSIALFAVVILAISPAASCTAPLAVHPAFGEWWANRLATFAGDRPAKPSMLALSSWSTGGVTLAWRRGPAFLPAPRADRWEVKIGRGDWTPATVTDVPGGTLSTWLDGPPPEDGTRVSVRGVNAAGAGPASSIRIAMPPLAGREAPEPGDDDEPRR